MAVPQASFQGAGDPCEVYADLLRLYILPINVMLGVVTWTGSNMGSIVFQTEVWEGVVFLESLGTVLE